MKNITLKYEITKKIVELIRGMFFGSNEIKAIPLKVKAEDDWQEM